MGCQLVALLPFTDKWVLEALLLVCLPFSKLEMKDTNILFLRSSLQRRPPPPAAIQDPGIEYYGYGIWPNEESLEKASFSLMATAEMAVKHFVSLLNALMVKMTCFDDFVKTHIICSLLYP